MSLERRNLLRAYGAELVLTPGTEGMKGAIRKAEEIAAENPAYFVARQFDNQANVKIHRETTGPEIVEAIESLDGRLDAFISGVGTGGTITGAGEVLKQRFPDIRIIALEPENSPVLSGGKPGPHKIQGIGAGFVPSILNTEIFDEIILVSNDDAFATARRAAKEAAILGVTPNPTVPAEIYLLGASPSSAEVAANLGIPYVFAQFLNSDEKVIDAAFEAYRTKFNHQKGTKPQALLALGVIVSETDEEAKELASDNKFVKVHLASGKSVTVKTLEQAEEFARQAGETYTVEEKIADIVHGSRETDASTEATKAPAASTAPTVTAAPTEAATAAPTDAATPAPTTAEVKKIIVGTGTQFPKVAFIDENGKLTGYDVELVKEIDKRLPEYEFELKTLDFANLLLSLETNKIDFVAHEMEKNPEREKKYLFNKEPYAFWKTKIIVAKDNDTVKSIDDLKGKKALTTATSAEATILENYNKANKNAIKIVYSNGAANDTVTQLATGRVDGSVGADFILPIIDPEGKIKTVGPILTESNILFVFRKDDPAEQVLSDRIDEAIKEIKADGTLAKLSLEWLKTDVTKETD
ncbi:unnamed protein product [Aphanomyces euteiches]